MPKWLPRANELLQLIGGGGYMCTPSQADLDGPLRKASDRPMNGSRAASASPATRVAAPGALPPARPAAYSPRPPRGPVAGHWLIKL